MNVDSDVVGRAALCWGQQWLWHQHHRPAGERPTLLFSWLMDLPPGISVEQLRAAVQVAVTRHSSLRTTFSVDGYGLPQQVIWSADAERYEFERFADETLAVEWLRGHMDIQSSWPFRVGVISSGGGWVRLGLAIHHLAADMYAHALLRDEFRKIIDGTAQGVTPTLPASGRQPTELAGFEQSPSGAATNERALAYWLRHDDELGEVLNSFRTGFEEPSEVMHVARVVSPVAMPRLDSLAAAAGSSRGAVAVAALACVLADYLNRAAVPMITIVANRHLPGLMNSVCSVAQGGVFRVDVPDPRKLDSVIPAAWHAGLAAIAHSYYDNDEVTRRMSSLEGPGQHPMLFPPVVNVVPGIFAGPNPWQQDRTGIPDFGPELALDDLDSSPLTARVTQVDQPCNGLSFHVLLFDSLLLLELKAGTHLLSAGDCQQLVIDAMRLIIEA